MSQARKTTTGLSDLGRYLRTETVGGMVLLVVTAIALVWANSPWDESYRWLRDLRIGPEALHLDLTVGEWAKDGLLTLFFFVVGLELKREFVVGELSNRRTAALPVIAALGGMVVPACIALAMSWGAPGAGQAWAIPMATDIAFALGVLAVTGSGLPSSARIFLLSLAVADDLGAILVIAVVFTSTFNLLAIAAAGGLFALYWYLQRRRVTSSWLYVPLAVAAWVAVHSSGVHAPIAGVVLGLLTRVKRDPYERQAPAVRLEHRLQPWSAGLAVPLFALFAAGVPIGLDALAELTTDRVALAVMVALVVGKLVGIFGFSAFSVRIGLAAKPADLAWWDMAAISMLGGVGFTVSLLIAELALPREAAELAKAGVLVASAVAALLASVMLVRRSRARAA